MTPPGSDFDPLQPDGGPRPLRPAVFPRFRVRHPIADVGCLALLGAAVLEMVAAATQALTEPAAPIIGVGQIGRLPVPTPAISFTVSDRLATFARAGANLTVALVLVVIVAVATSRNRDQGTEHPVGLGRALMLASAVLASVVILADVAVCIEILRSAKGAFSGTGQTNRAASFLQFLAPTGLSIGVLWYAGTCPPSPIPPRTLSEVSAE